MAKRAPADPDKFDEASKWFRARTPVTKAEWDAMSSKARRQSFTIAGTQQLKVVQTVFDSLQKAIDKGTPIEQWRKELAKKLKSDFASKNSATLTTAFINANQTAYNTGRYYQLNDPAVTAAVPYLTVDAVLDDRTTQLCIELNGTTRRNDDPWWLTHWPPFHHRCRTAIRGLTEGMVKRRGGITKTLPRPHMHDDWGLAPPLRAGQIWEPKREDFDPSAYREYEKKLGQLKAKPANDTEPPSKRLGDVGEKVFGRRITDAELESLFGMKAKLPPGFTLAINDVRENAQREYVRVVGNVRDASGNLAATITRSYRKELGATVVKHETFFVDREHQGRGLGKAIFNAQVNAYERTGLVTNVTLNASEVGRYVWTKAGFDWANDAQKTELLSKLREHLTETLSVKAADKIMTRINTPQDVAALVVKGKRVGKELLIGDPNGAAIPMHQVPSRIKRL